MNSILIAWLVAAAVLVFVAIALGKVVRQAPLGILIDNRGRYSLTQLQLVLWSAVAPRAARREPRGLPRGQAPHAGRRAEGAHGRAPEAGRRPGEGAGRGSGCGAAADVHAA